MAMRDAYSATTPTLGAGNARQLHAIGGAIAIQTVDLALNRTTGLFRAPAGFTVVDHFGLITDCDTNASPALVFTIGDAGSANRFLTASTAGQAGGALGAIAPTTGINYRFATETEIMMTATTAAATAAAGTLTYFLLGFFD